MVSLAGSGWRREGVGCAKHHIPAQSTSSMLARGTIEPRALEVATTQQLCWRSHLPSPVWPGNAFEKEKESENIVINQLFITTRLHDYISQVSANAASGETALNSQERPFWSSSCVVACGVLRVWAQGNAHGGARARGGTSSGVCCRYFYTLRGVCLKQTESRTEQPGQSINSFPTWQT